MQSILAMNLTQLNFFLLFHDNKNCQKTIKHDLWELDINKGKFDI